MLFGQLGYLLAVSMVEKSLQIVNVSMKELSMSRFKVCE